MELGELMSSGKGKYQRRPANGHVLIIGGGVQHGKPVVMRGFLEALVGPGRNKGNLPEVVLMARTPCTDELRGLMKINWLKKVGVHYFVGYDTPAMRHLTPPFSSLMYPPLLVERSALMHALHRLLSIYPPCP